MLDLFAPLLERNHVPWVKVDGNKRIDPNVWVSRGVSDSGTADVNKTPLVYEIIGSLQLPKVKEILPLLPLVASGDFLVVCLVH